MLTNQDKWGALGRILAPWTNYGEHISVGVWHGVCTPVSEGRKQGKPQRPKPL